MSHVLPFKTGYANSLSKYQTEQRFSPDIRDSIDLVYATPTADPLNAS